MSDWTRERWTGRLGLAAAVIQLVGFGFAFSPGLPPSLADRARLLSYLKSSDSQLLTSALLFFLGFALYLAFLAGFRAIVADAAAKHEWLASAAFAWGVLAIALEYVGIGLVATAVAEAAGNADAASVRTLVEAGAVLVGAPSLVLVAFFLGVAGSAGAQVPRLPRWLAVVAWVGSVLVLAASVFLHGGSDPTVFFSADGLVAGVALVPFYVWTIASVANLRLRSQR